MIRSGGVLIGVASALVLGALLAMRPADAAAADPPRAERRHETLRSVAREADERLGRLEQALDAAIEHGRRAAALTVAGSDPAPPAYEAAAGTLEDSVPPAAEAAEAVDHLRGALAAVRPGSADLPAGVSGSDLLGTAAQLRESGEAAGPFVRLRLAAEGTLAAMEDALAALDADDPDGALDALDAAATARDVVAEWEDPPAVLPIWLETTAEVIAAAREIAQATIQGDAQRAEQAVAAYRRAIEGARQADVALALAISETGSGIAVTPLRRLADAAATTAAQRAAVASVLQEVP
jgi:tetratricopeptide (TPR) repeat protein